MSEFQKFNIKVLKYLSLNKSDEKVDAIAYFVSEIWLIINEDVYNKTYENFISKGV